MWQLIGQTRAVSLLKHSLDSDTLSHAYLFIGPPHVGKMTLAVLLAQALNCQADDKPCLKCDSCRRIGACNHSDVQVLRLEQNEEENTEAKLIHTEQVKDMLHSASLPPFEGKNKVFIINGAELLSVEAANRLLKTLEEPEARVTFILLSSDETRLLETVISRCQRIELQPMSIEAETKALVERGIEAERASLLAGLSHGCPGWAIAAAGEGKIMEQRDNELNQIIDIIKNGYEERFAYAARLAEGFSKNRKAVYDALDMWRDLWRDLMLIKMGREEMLTNIDRKDILIKISGNYSISSMRNYIQSIASAGVHLKQNVNARLALEVLVLDIPREEAKSPDKVGA